jgi:Spy/CpxP family protein refolding chaperone
LAAFPPNEAKLKLRPIACLVAVLQLTSVALAQVPASPYAGQDERDIKALSPEDIDSYQSGKGLGLAKAAELNGYAGPRHVLELASQLNLTPEQRAKTEALFTSMTSEAASLGQLLVLEERKLDRLFAAKVITPELLSNSLREIGALQARVRAAHLLAHIAQVDILSREQNRQYVQLRGYESPGAHPGHGTQHAH